ncbi:MAG: hypothetical protein ACT6RL_19445 [Neoaquamicrobium sediminum]|uniref:hypothetical protein n=1 Tax=Neoaquamicrobium sediminum TaxID=1849104 RepID=UPI0040356737
MDKRLFETMPLLPDSAPLIFRGGDFTVKGATAINLFHRDTCRQTASLRLAGNRRAASPLPPHRKTAITGLQTSAASRFVDSMQLTSETDLR